MSQDSIKPTVHAPAYALPADIAPKRGRGRPRKVVPQAHTTASPSSQLDLSQAPALPLDLQQPPSTHAPSPPPQAPSSEPRDTEQANRQGRPWWYGELPYPHHMEIVRTAARHALKDQTNPTAHDLDKKQAPFLSRDIWDLAQELAEQSHHDPSLISTRLGVVLSALLGAQGSKHAPLGDTISDLAKLPHGIQAQSAAMLSIMSAFLSTGCQTIELDGALADALMRSIPADLPEDDPCPHLPYPVIYIAFADRAPRTDDGLVATITATAKEMRGLPHDVRGLYVWEGSNSKWLLYAYAPPLTTTKKLPYDCGYWWVIDWRLTPTLAQARALFEQQAARAGGVRGAAPESFAPDTKWALTSLAAVLSQYLASGHARTVVTEPEEAVTYEREAATLPDGGKRKERLLDLARRIRRRTLRTIQIVTPKSLADQTQLQLLDDAAPRPKGTKRGHWVRGHVRLLWTGARDSPDRKQTPRFIFPFYKQGGAVTPADAIDRIAIAPRDRQQIIAESLLPAPGAVPPES